MYLSILKYMDELRKVIGQNLAELRKRHGLTQLELAEKFSYTDRAISKWENGDTLPDVEVLYNLCEYYGVTIDYLTHEENARFVKKVDPLNSWNKIAITSLVSMIIWTLATVVFVISLLKGATPLWQAFIWAVPVNCVFLVVFIHLYFHMRLITFLSWSIFIWSVLAAAYLSLLDMNIWPVFLLGVPAQATMIIWLNLRKMIKIEKNEKK